MEKELLYKKLLEGCESEKIHLSGAIQAFGSLLRVDRQTMSITHASANINHFSDIPLQEILSSKVEALSWGIEETIQNLGTTIGESAHIKTKINGQTVDLNIHSDNGGVIVELEENVPVKTIAGFDTLLTNLPETDADIIEYSNRLVKAITQVGNFERVMVYKFLNDWSGEVIAEHTNSELGSYLGLRFPASDIPNIARNLYLINPSRAICDTSKEPIAILSSSTDAIDLTYSQLRSVAPVHLEYLANMGVKSSFSFPIKSLGGLWGMVACHNSYPNYVSVSTRQTCVDTVKNYALGISSFRMLKKMKTIDSMELRLKNLVDSITAFDDMIDGMQQNGRELLDLFAANGFAFETSTHGISIGTTPQSSIIQRIKAAATEAVFAVDNIGLLLDGYNLDNQTTGALVIKVKTSKYGDAVMCWFRPEEPSEVHWAGNPQKLINENPNAIALSPRKSFEKWVEERRGYSREWGSEDRAIAFKVRNLTLTRF